MFPKPAKTNGSFHELVLETFPKTASLGRPTKMTQRERQRRGGASSCNKGDIAPAASFSKPGIPPSDDAPTHPGPILHLTLPLGPQIRETTMPTHTSLCATKRPATPHRCLVGGDQYGPLEKKFSLFRNLKIYIIICLNNKIHKIFVN